MEAISTEVGKGRATDTYQYHLPLLPQHPFNPLQLPRPHHEQQGQRQGKDEGNKEG